MQFGECMVPGEESGLQSLQDLGVLGVIRTGAPWMRGQSGL